MKEIDDYPELGQLFGVYLNQDYEYWGNTVEDVVSCYVTDSGSKNVAALLSEIDDFAKAHPNDLDDAFNRRYGFDFSPRLWGHTTASFLVELKRLLKKRDTGAS